MRTLTTFACDDETLVGTLDEAPGTTGLLIVSGGNEPRCGAHRGMALLGGEIAANGAPVFRYDRRGIGDSTGSNAGFLSARDDLFAATQAFRRDAPHIEHIVGFGNCDAASTLALFGREAGIDRVLLANPWTIETIDDLPPAAAIRARYATRLRQPAEWRRLLNGGVDLTRLISGLKKLAAGESQSGFPARVIGAIASWGDDARIILADGDATAIAFADVTRKAVAQFRSETIATDSHSFARSPDKAALLAAIERLIASQTA